MPLLFKRKVGFDERELKSVLEACKHKNTQAQDCLIRTFAGFAQSVASRYAASPEEAEEIVNDAFLKAIQNLKQYDQEQPFRAWFRRIIINTAVDYHRRNIRWQTISIPLEDIDVEDWSIDILSDISAQEILEFVQRLPPAYRIVFTLFVVDGYSHKEIAAMLGIQEGTSKSNMRDARRKLQSMIRISYPDLYHNYNQPGRINED